MPPAYHGCKRDAPMSTSVPKPGARKGLTAWRMNAGALPGWSVRSKAPGTARLGMRECRITDLSVGGCFLDAYASQPVGARITVEIKLRGQSFRLPGRGRLRGPRPGVRGEVPRPGLAGQPRVRRCHRRRHRRLRAPRSRRRSRAVDRRRPAGADRRRRPRAARRVPGLARHRSRVPGVRRGTRRVAGRLRAAARRPAPGDDRRARGGLCGRASDRRHASAR